jgi:small-conductance mechanosensitive channel
MSDRLVQLFGDEIWQNHLVRITLFFLLAWLIHRVGRRAVSRVVHLSRVSSNSRRPGPERQATLRGLIAGAVSFIAFAGAIVASLGQFVPADTLVWMVGLFSAGFGFSLRPVLSDFIAGVGLIFEDAYAVGEKVQILEVEGVVEAVSLRTTRIRAPTGELYLVPNGEVRLVRNFSRGRFSTVKITLKIATADLERAVASLEGLSDEALLGLPNLVEPWQVLSESGVIGQQTELTLLAKARFGKAAEMRPRLRSLLQEHLSAAGIELVS